LRGALGSACQELKFGLTWTYRRLTGTSALGPLAASYARMLEDMARCPPRYAPSEHWRDVNRAFTRHLHVGGLDRFKSRFFGRRWAAYAPDHPRIYESFIWQYHSRLALEDDERLLERVAEPERGANDVMPVAGRLFSSDLLQSIDEYYAICRGLPARERSERPSGGDLRRPRVVMELGAGYGRLAWLFLTVRPGTTYVIVDLPESLVVSQHYLTAELPHLRVARYEETRLLERVSRADLTGRDLWFFLPWQLDRLEDLSVDAFVNIYSLQEMTRENISAYLAAAGRLTRRRAYVKQHRTERNLADGIVVTSADYPVPSGWRMVAERTCRLWQHVFERTYDIG
jgi:putative sugar O-methyltransferase